MVANLLNSQKFVGLICAVSEIDKPCGRKYSNHERLMKSFKNYCIQIENRWDSDGSGAFGHARLNKLKPEGETEEIRRNELCLLSNFLDAGLL